MEGGDDRRARLEFPKHFSGAIVEGDQVALRIAGEDQSYGGREQSCGRSSDHVEAPLGLSGGGIDGQDRACPMRARRAFDVAGLIPLAGREVLLALVEQVAVFTRAEIVEASPRAVGCGLPVMAAAQARTSELAFFGWLLTGDQNRASVRTDSIRPSHLRIGSGFDDLAIGAVERVEKAVAIGLNESLHFASVN